MYFDVNPSDLFAPAEIERARAYHRPLYRALGVDLALELGILAAIVFGPPGDWLAGATGGGWWGRGVEACALGMGVSTLVRLPLSWWPGRGPARGWGVFAPACRRWRLGRVIGVPRCGRCAS